MSTVYTTLYSAILAILNGISGAENWEIHQKPVSKFGKYPAIVFFPSSVDNVFDTTAENKRNHKFKLFVIVGVEQTDLDTVFGTVLANACDKVISAFDSGWSLTTIDGHRCWIRIDAGNWNYDNTEGGAIAYAEFDLIVQLLTNN